jgi:microcystin-dependent protein
MSQPYVGEIRMFGGNFPPSGWMLCQGQLLPISEWETLFNLIGTTYGGDGQSTFALPNLQSRAPVHMGSNAGQTFVIGETGGQEDVVLSVQQLPSHNHAILATSAPGTLSKAVSGSALASEGPSPNSANVYAAFGAPTQVTLAAQTIGQTGSNLAHSNIQPVLAINFIISMFGIFPSQ